MSEKEYDSQREVIRQEIIEELEDEYKKVPWFTPLFALILFGWLYPNLVKGFPYYPKTTIVISIMCGSMYVMLLYFYIALIRKNLTLE